MISEFIFALFHLKAYNFSFIQAYKDYKESKKLFNVLLKEQKLREEFVKRIEAKR